MRGSIDSKHRATVRTEMARSKISKKGKMVTKQMVRQMVDSQLEHKNETFVLGSTAWATAGLITPLTQIILEGGSINQRDGAYIRVRKLSFKVSGFAAAATTTIGRVIIFADMLAQGGSPVVTDVLDTASYISGYAPTNAQRKRFKVFYDKPMVLVDTASNGGVFRELEFKMNHEVFYSGTTNAPGSNGKGAIFVLFIASSANGTYNFSVQTSFTDA